MAFVSFTPNHQPAPACYPADVNGMLDLLTTGGALSGTIPDQSGGGVFVGSSPPSSSLTNKVWYKTDAAGRPLGVYMFYNGNWRKVYTGAVLGEIRMYIGAPNFDGTGRAIIGSDLDGWALCNGNNGTPNLHNFFPLGSGNYQGGQGWIGNPSGGAGQTSGGHVNILIQTAHLPALEIQTGQIGVNLGNAINVSTPGPSALTYPVRDAPGGNVIGQPPNPVPLDNIPPWISMAFIMFVGYL